MRKKKILVIDDDEMNLQIAKMILERKLSCEVIGVDNGMAGIEILRNQRVNLVLLDILMPDFDGIETLKEIRTDDKIKDASVMMLTASGDIENIQKVGLLGVKDYIKKPFMPADLIKRVKEKLDEQASLLEKILIIGSDAAALKSAQNFVEENFPYEVLTADNAADTIKIITNAEIVLVVALADMNFLDGFRVLKFLAYNEQFANLPFVVTAQDKLAEMLEKIPDAEDTPPKADEKPPVEKVTESAVTHTEKKQMAKVVTNFIGYELDLHV